MAKKKATQPDSALETRRRLLGPALLTLEDGCEFFEPSTVINAFRALTETGREPSEEAKRRLALAGRVVVTAVRHALQPTVQGDRWLKAASRDLPEPG